MKDSKPIYRPSFPKRAVITAGMPYGNKALHFGHIGGMFVHADTFARFMRDRIGSENVIFVSGTDCYGSPIIASYKSYIDNFKGDQPLSLEDYVMKFHHGHKHILQKYEIAPNLFASSAFGEGGQMHTEVSAKLFDKLYQDGYLKKMSTKQFFDPEENVYLNGRQVIGECPIDGCKSEKGYADECSLGHQYMPSDLLNPVSQLSGKTPQLIDVENWYFRLDDYTKQIKKMVDILKKERLTRPSVTKTTEEFLEKPAIHITRKEFDRFKDTHIALDYYTLIDEPKKPSVTYEFENLEDREIARDILAKNGINFRTSKALVPFRLSGNIEWGVPVPQVDGLNDLTFWVWPESLWAPVSFTKTYLQSIGKDPNAWTDWWINKDAKVYQFIGEDNIYFYGVAQMGLTLAYLGYTPNDERDLHEINLPRLVANFHLQFLNSKASSSGKIKPPMADELLEHYTAEQLRMYFLSLGVSKKGVSFDPKPFNPNATNEPDPVLKDGNLLTNVFNRTIRSAFYTAQKYTNARIPNLAVSDEIVNLIQKDTYDYEKHMHKQELHRVVYTLDHVIRHLSKHWAKESKKAGEDVAALSQLLADTFYAIKSVLTLIHPLAPASAEAARERLNLSEDLWNWEHILKPTEFYMEDPANHILNPIPPKYDFFSKHASQLQNEN